MRKEYFFCGAMLLVLSYCTPKEPEINVDVSHHVWELEERWDLEQSVYNPRAMWRDKEGQVIFYDIDAQSPVKIFRNNRIVHNLIQGNGPGEVSRGQKLLSEDNHKRYLFDAGQNRLMEFDEQFDYVRDIEEEILEKGIYFSGVYSDSLLFASSAEYILEITSLGVEGPVSEGNVLFTLHTGDYHFLDPLRNFLLLQTFFFETADDALYAAMENSSLIFRIDSDLNFHYTFAPDSIGLPVNEQDGFYSLPRIGHHREGLRDLSVHGDYLFAILNGQEYGRFTQLRYRNNFDDFLEIIRHGEVLLIYNRHTLDFIKAVELPIPSLKIDVSDDGIYLLSTLDNEFPFINVYRNNFLSL